MKYYTHVVFGLLCAKVIQLTVNVESYSTLFLAFLVALFGSLLPDIDTPKSKLGKYFFFLNYGLTHRGFLHTFWGLLFIVLLSTFVKVTLLVSDIVYLSFIAGYASHLLLDGLTKKGIRLLPPFKLKMRGFFRTGGLREKMLFVIFLIVLVIL